MAGANNLTVIAGTVFFVLVVPVVFSTTRFTIYAFVENPSAKRERKEDSEFCPPSIGMLPAKTGIKNHAATSAVLRFSRTNKSKQLTTCHSYRLSFRAPCFWREEPAFPPHEGKCPTPKSSPYKSNTDRKS